MPRPDDQPIALVDAPLTAAGRDGVAEVIVLKGESYRLRGKYELGSRSDDDED